MSATRGQRKPARRRRNEVPQLDLGAQVHAGRADLRPTRALLRHASCPRVLDLVRQVRWFFPELDGKEIRVGLTRAAAGFAARNEDWIWINPYRLTRHTIAHELTHLLQNDGHVPQGEKSADLFALARHLSVVDDLPCYLVTPVSFQRAWQAAERRQGESVQMETKAHRVAPFVARDGDPRHRAARTRPDALPGRVRARSRLPVVGRGSRECPLAPGREDQAT